MEDEDVEGRSPDVRRSTEGRPGSHHERTARREELKRKLDASSAEAGGTSRNCSDRAVLAEGKNDECDSEFCVESPSRSSGPVAKTPTKVTFEGFKKRILSEARENRISAPRPNNNRSSGKKRREKRGVSTASEAKRGKITEYAQYLGLQPASNKANCANCRGTTNSCDPSMLDQHRCTCPSGMMMQSTGLSSPGTSDSCTGAGSPATPAASAANNFRITRKVYLCAACGTYFENWNLFLHMREIHKRHICLFCLGMFGQAERLSYHLTKKHNVPETTFTSVRDFYDVFKGSCYLICCTCEKVFAETDNFYNHYCSPVHKGRASSASEMCSLCRQNVNNHSSACGHAEARDCSNQSNVGLPGIPGGPVKTGDSKSTSARGGNKRMLKNNRLKRNEASALTSYQQKMANLYARKTSLKSREESTGYSTVKLSDETSALRSLETGGTFGTTPTNAGTVTTATMIPTTTAIAVNSRIGPTEVDTLRTFRDTVSETIMEVSKCTDDPLPKDAPNEPLAGVLESSNSSPIKVVASLSPSLSLSSLSSPLRPQPDASTCYDSVTETIMEVSRCCNDNVPESSEDEARVDEANNRFARNETSSRDSDVDALIMDDAGLSDDNAETSNVARRYEDRLESGTNAVGNERRRKRRRRMHGRNEETVRDSDSEAADSESSGNEATSPSRRESAATSTNSARSRHNVDRERNISQSSSSPDKESRTTSAVSFTTVNSTDRSLVIKICTNRNAQFSVTRSGSNGNPENHDNGRESEENNNAEDSASEGKTSNRSERGDRDSVNSCHEDDDEERSDTDSVKLSIADAKPVEETPEVSDEIRNIPNETENRVQTNDNENAKRDETENRLETKSPSKEVCRGEESLEKDETVEAVKATSTEETVGIVLASDDVPSTDLMVDGILESMTIEDLLRRCVSAASGFCVYCNHARRIAVNGKQLGLHVLAEHRFQPQHPAIIIQREQLIVLLKKSLDEVASSFFNLDSYDNAKGTYHIATPRVFECFHCRYHSLVHKDIYLHNRKMHQKTILICIMCKSTFYSYSELLCHLCPGVYSPNINVTYRCCLCPVTNLPSAFRLMVHLRKRHHSCDVCLESTGNQQRLSNHVWKHKLHHLCYRCGIAYRNKPDITKHLFWKHGTESVLCKKCLQKKWPHVYHFCIPPTAFVCEECASTFTRAVALKVHKRLHTGDRPYGCGECDERFISKKLAARHEAQHREPKPIEPEVTAREEKEAPLRQEEKAFSDKPTMEDMTIEDTTMITTATTTTTTTTMTTTTTTTTTETTTTTATAEASEANKSVADPPCELKEPKEPVKKVVDVYDLPPLNLSSDSDTDVEEPPAPAVAPKDVTDGKTAPEEIPKISTETSEDVPESTEKSCTDPSDAVLDVELNEDEKKEEAQIMDGIWDNFKTYAASLEQREATIELGETESERFNREYLCKVILADHDYCVVYTDKSVEEEPKKAELTKLEDGCATMEGEHDYGYKIAKSPSNASGILNCDSDTNTGTTKKKKEKTPKKKIGNTSSSESSSDSDSSSCSCGTNCSCSSSSSGSSSSSSSSSDSDSSASESSPRKQTVRKERRRDKEKEAPTEPEIPKANATKSESPMEIIEPTIVPEATDRKDTKEDVAELKIEVNDRPPSPQLIFRESDLDTEETETDEDFYDEHPQQLANKLLAEKRNQLMLLAAVAPPSTEAVPAALPNAPENLNNGTLENLLGNTNSLAATESLNDAGEFVHDVATTMTTSTGSARKRVKTKKRKKSDRVRSGRPIGGSGPTPTVESIKLNIPKSFYDKKTKKFGSKATSLVTLVPSRSSTPSITNSLPHSEGAQQKFANDASKAVSLAGSGSENDNKRSSKRKRVPKRFYGDSSDEEAQQQHTDHHHHHHHHHHQQPLQPQQQQQQQQQQQPQQPQHYNQPTLKWRKVEPPVLPSVSVKTPTPVLPSTNVSYATKSVTLRLPGFDRPMERIVPVVTGPSESEEQVESSTAESSENEEPNVVRAPEQPQQPQQPQQQQHFGPPNLPIPPHHGPNTTRIAGLNPPVGRSENLYCYCQCPYDEVSDMIACDGNDCRIEWFHFECVGIMVPPKGKWYCPDCRKRDSTLVNDDFLE